MPPRTPALARAGAVSPMPSPASSRPASRRDAARRRAVAPDEQPAAAPVAVRQPIAAPPRRSTTPATSPTRTGSSAGSTGCGTSASVCTVPGDCGCSPLVNAGILLDAQRRGTGRPLRARRATTAARGSSRGRSCPRPSFIEHPTAHPKPGLADARPGLDERDDELGRGASTSSTTPRSSTASSTPGGRGASSGCPAEAVRCDRGPHPPRRALALSGAGRRSGSTRSTGTRSIYAADATVTGDPDALATPFRRQLARFVAGARRGPAGGAGNFGPGLRFHYLPAAPAQPPP